MLCGLLGVSRQAHYKSKKAVEKSLLEEQIVLSLVKEIRSKLPRVGARKLYHLIKSDMEENGLKIGRDRLFDILRSNQMLVKTRRNKAKTTFSYRWFNRFDNLTKDIRVTAPNQLWVSDITYVRTGNRFLYLSLVTDAYSRRIVGHHLSKSLDRAGCVQALKMALSTTEKTSGLIHHSDRGVQYCSKEYTTLLEQNQIRISMTQNSQPLDNPIAERINGIIKAEFLDKYNLKGLTEARMQVRKAVALYNQIRPHNSLKLATPNQVHYIYDNLQQELKTVVNL